MQAAAGRSAFVDFPVEYPPLSWWIMQLPGTVDRLAYYFRFRAFMAAADVVSFALLAWIVSKRRPPLLTAFAWVYIGATIILAHELYDRLDMGVLFFVSVALAAWLAARPDARDARRSAWWLAGAYAAAGLGTAYKIFPAVIAPLFIASELLTRARVRGVLLRIALFLSFALGPVALTYWSIGRPAFGFLAYHGARGLEIGSTWASVLWVLSLAGVPAHVDIRFGSWEVVSQAESAVSRAASLAMVLVPLLLVGWALLLRGRFDRDRTFAQAALALSGVVVMSNVFSPQFLLWAIPAIALVAVEACATKIQYVIVGAWLLVCAAVTLLIYEGGGSVELRAMTTWVMLALLIRNLMYVSLWVYLAGALVKRDLMPLQARRP